MDTFRETVLAACCAALALTLAEGVLPAEKFGRQLRLMLSLLMMTAILAPLTQLQLTLPETDTAAAETAQDLTAAAAEAYRQAYAERITAALNNALAEHHVSCTVQAVDVHIAEDGSIVINEAVITGNTLTGTVYLREWLGETVRITREEDAA